MLDVLFAQALARRLIILTKEKYHCTADLLFCSFRFSCFAYDELTTDTLIQVYCTVILPPTK